MPTWLEAGLWCLLGGAALLGGAWVAWFVQVPQRVIASVMAFGSGVLISAVALDLVQEAADGGGLVPTAIGFLGGALALPGREHRTGTARGSAPQALWRGARGGAAVRG